MSSPNIKGSEFEAEARGLLHQLIEEHPTVASLTEKPILLLQNGETVIPDFHLVVEYLAETRHYFIECQDRTHQTHAILHKIQHVRAKQALKTFFFIYRDIISKELARAMDEEGIVHCSLADFGDFLIQVSRQLDSQPERPKSYSAPVYGGIDGNDLDVAFIHAATRLQEARSRDHRCSCIAIALYFIEAREDSRGGKSINTIKFLRKIDRARFNPFASYYIGWFDYTNGVRLDDEPEFFERVYHSERAAFRRFANFCPTGSDLILCDVVTSPTGPRVKLSTAMHVKLSNLRRLHVPIEETLLELMTGPCNTSCLAGAWAVDGGLLASQETVVGSFAQYLEGKEQQARSAYDYVGAPDQDILPGDCGGEIEI